MKSFLNVIFLMSALACAAQTSTEKAILTLSKNKFNWMIHHRTDSLAAMLDDHLSYIHSDGSMDNKKTFLEGIQSKKIVYQQIKLANLKAIDQGSVQVVIGYGLFSGVEDGEAFTLNLLFTEIYMKTKTGWMLIARHGNRR